MSHRQQAKKQAFAAAQRKQRVLKRIMKRNLSNPGFIGATGTIYITTPEGQFKLGPGALFIR